jgi:putative FmdB family regulatory protein
MPTYEYRCKKCGHTFETFQKITEDPIDLCPECGGAAERLIGLGGGFILSGSRVDYGHDDVTTRCGKESPCCGREMPCSVRPCEE